VSPVSRGDAAASERTGHAELHHDVAIIGGGTAAETLVRELVGCSVVVFEDERVGGECPFVACMPSKSMLHDARLGRAWDDAVSRRKEITEGLDDGGHASDLRGDGATLVRARATLVDAHTIDANGARHTADHVVLATGATPIRLDTAGIESCADRVWTSADAMTSAIRPERLVVIGAGVIGLECATMFAGFGADVVVVDSAEVVLPEAPPPVGRIVADGLRACGVELLLGREAARFVDRPDGLTVELDDGTLLDGDHVLVAIGRRPATEGVGVERIGLDPASPLPVAPNGRVACVGSVWAIGDVAGRGQYTHLANHQARVVADHLVGGATRTFDDVVVPACVFTTPPVIRVGASWGELDGDPDVVEASVDLASFPRALTDQLVDGHLWVAARRSSGCIVAAAGAGPRFDELVHSLVVAVDGRVPVARLRQSMQPFPTVGEVLGPLFAELDLGLRSNRPGLAGDGT
jgi:dihydrolipoamide dehydrogenase